MFDRFAMDFNRFEKKNIIRVTAIIGSLGMVINVTSTDYTEIKKVIFVEYDWVSSRSFTSNMLILPDTSEDDIDLLLFLIYVYKSVYLFR